MTYIIPIYHCVPLSYSDVSWNKNLWIYFDDLFGVQIFKLINRPLNLTSCKRCEYRRKSQCQCEPLHIYFIQEVMIYDTEFTPNNNCFPNIPKRTLSRHSSWRCHTCTSWKFFLKFNSWWFLLQFGWFSKFKHESIFLLMFSKEVRWFHKCYNFCDKQMENNVIHLFIRVFLDHWIGVYDEKKKSKQKIMTKIRKKLSQKSSYPWKIVVCVASKQLPHQQMNSIPFPMPLWCHRNCACYSILFT